MKESKFDKIDEWFEGWEGDFELIQEQNYEGLLKLRKSRAFDNPDDLYAQYYYGEALVLNKMYDEAINFIRPIYIQNPDIDDFVFVILDALYLSGRTEKDFEWIEYPEVKKIDNEILRECYKCIRIYGNSHINVVMGHLSGKYLSYLGFSEAKLLESLKNDPRFNINKDNTVSLSKTNDATHR